MAKETNELKHCPNCKHPVSIKWIAGMSGGLASLCDHPLGGSPGWYIKCESCTYMMYQELTTMSYNEQQKCRRRLIKRWNETEDWE